jgi:acylphosphatase
MAVAAKGSISNSRLLSFDYEIFGKVQGVFFRKCTAEEGKKLKLVGWVMNTEQDTVVGQAQGPEDKIKKLKEWLRKTGSPKSRIDKAEFKNEKEIIKLDFTAFDVRK